MWESGGTELSVGTCKITVVYETVFHESSLKTNLIKVRLHSYDYNHITLQVPI